MQISRYTFHKHLNFVVRDEIKINREFSVLATSRLKISRASLGEELARGEGFYHLVHTQGKGVFFMCVF